MIRGPLLPYVAGRPDLETDRALYLEALAGYRGPARVWFRLLECEGDDLTMVARLYCDTLRATGEGDQSLIVRALFNTPPDEEALARDVLLNSDPDDPDDPDHWSYRYDVQD